MPKISSKRALTERQETKKNMILQAHKNIMECGKCEEGYIVLDNVAMPCKCVDDIFKDLRFYEDVEVSVIDKDYDDYIKTRHETFSTKLLDKRCPDCDHFFQTYDKGRVRCDECFQKYLNDFREVGQYLKKDDIYSKKFKNK